MIKLSQKRTCEDCKALEMLSNSFPSCLLKYNFDYNNCKPLEPCPKPKTIKEFFECDNLYRKTGGFNNG